MVLICFANFRSSDYEVIQWRVSEHKSWQIKNQLSNVNSLKMVSNLQFKIDGEFHQYFSLSIYLLIPTGYLLSVTWDHNRHSSIIGLYYLLHTNIDLNLIPADHPGFEPRSLGPKVAMLPLCYTPLTHKHF